jgi:hypothetical protein
MSGARATRVHFRKSSEAVACSFLFISSRLDGCSVYRTAACVAYAKQAYIGYKIEKNARGIPSEMPKIKGTRGRIKIKGTRGRIDEESITKNHE